MKKTLWSMLALFSFLSFSSLSIAASTLDGDTSVNNNKEEGELSSKPRPIVIVKEDPKPVPSK